MEIALAVTVFLYLFTYQPEKQNDKLRIATIKVMYIFLIYVSI